MSTHYEILGVGSSAGIAEIRAAYVRLIKEAHPDVNPELENSTERAILIVNAYAVLRDKKKRLEYDLWLDSKRATPERQTPRPPSSQSPPPPRQETSPSWTLPVAPFFCESCKNEDVVLKSYSFAWVVSFIIDTRHGQETLVLCNACRMRKSIVYTVRALLLGWWAVPIGFTMTLAAIGQNVFGGLFPKEGNESLLAVHGYQLFIKGLYREALESFELSQRLEQTRDKGAFIERLRRLTLPLTRREALMMTFTQLNPAWLIIPFLVGLIFAGIKATTSAAAYYRDQTTLHAAGVEGLSPAEAQRLNDEAQSVGVDLGRFDGDRDGCFGVVTRVSLYVHQNMPLIGTHRSGAIIVDDYAFARDRLSADTLMADAQIVRSNLDDATNLTQTVVSQSNPMAPPDLSRYIESQLDFMRSCLYNVAIIAVSVRQNNADNPFNESFATVQSIQDLQVDPLIGNWIASSGQESYLAILLHTLSIEEKAQSLQGVIAQSQQEVGLLQQQMDDYKTAMANAKSMGNFVGYNDLVPEYNADLNRSASDAAAIDSEVKQYNGLVHILNKNPLSDQFNECINNSILLKKFDFVNLAGKPAN